MRSLIHSLGYRSDLFFQQLKGGIEEKQDYFVVRTPSIPSFVWGNYLLFKKAPVEGDFVRWTTFFESEFSGLSGRAGMAFGWDSTTGEVGDLEEFTQNGFTLEQSVVMVATNLRKPEKFFAGLEVRPLQSDADWQEVVALIINGVEREKRTEKRSHFIQARMHHYRELTKAGLGYWFGGFFDGRMVANLGIFKVEGLGRFQEVVVHSEYRRKGVCGALAFGSGQFAFSEMDINPLVIVAEENGPAMKIYQSLGFQVREKQVGICKMI